MSEITIEFSGGPEVSDAGRDCRFVFSPSNTVHERDECSDDDHEYEFSPTCGQRLPEESHWGRVDADSAEEIAEKHPHLAFCTRCFSNILRLREIQRENQ